MARSNFDLNAFSKLVLDEGNVTKSWNSWLMQFQLSVEVTFLNLGSEEVEHKSTSLITHIYIIIISISMSLEVSNPLLVVIHHMLRVNAT